MRNVNKIEWEDVDMVELKGITPKLTENEWIILNNNIEYKEARRKASSVLYFLKKHIILNEGFFSKSIDNIHAMFKRNKNYISTGQLKNIVNKLKELGLICVKRIKKRNVYTLPLADKLAEKLADKKQAQPVENIEIGSNLKKHKYGIKDNTILNTNKENGTDLISKLKKVYRGVKPSLVASKKQLRDIAQSILVAKGLHSNTYFDKAVQYLVYKKIKYSNQKINLLGAVSYIEKIIEDRLDAYNNKLVEVPNYITGEPNNLRFNDFPQRKYDYDALERELLGWN